jgi:hypothetical protein
MASGEFCVWTSLLLVMTSLLLIVRGVGEDFADLGFAGMAHDALHQPEQLIGMRRPAQEGDAAPQSRCPGLRR